ncbi:hypothetical protein QMK54_22165 [Pseudomonas sp. P5_109]|jgi:hypothetical protein|uniref:hypothetical protein n=1 Tax=unclassified Pseudomonas TaxID=196821 RepID=UPI001CBC9867|nr:MULTISPECIES: hypothetical protein [unclassified Pseudomonas]WPN28520.1 hypothetical protein QMK54_22165 [Pseudomonas sp. P5_109]
MKLAMAVSSMLNQSGNHAHKTRLQTRGLVLNPIDENRKLNVGTWYYGRTEPLPNCVQSAVLD